MFKTIKNLAKLNAILEMIDTYKELIKINIDKLKVYADKLQGHNEILDKLLNQVTVLAEKVENIGK